MLSEVRLIPIEIAEAYAEILQLRLAVQEAELALRMSARSRRRRSAVQMPELISRASQDRSRRRPLAALGRRFQRTRCELAEKIEADQADDVAGLKHERQQNGAQHDR